MKTKYPRADAMAVAAVLCRLLRPFCERLVVAGSLRRRKAWVGDVEIVYIPKFEERVEGLILPLAPMLCDTKRVSLVDEALDGLLADQVLNSRKNVNGSITWGEKNKLAVHLESGIPMDFFATKESSWFNYLVCRTGGAECNTRIASAAQRKGWMWHPYGRGFTDEEGRWVAVECEQDVFRLAGLPYLEPWER